MTRSGWFSASRLRLRSGDADSVVSPRGPPWFGLDCGPNEVGQTPLRGSDTTVPRPLPKISEITNRARKTKSKTLAITARLPARVTNPRTPAIKARTGEHDCHSKHGTLSFLEKEPRSGLSRDQAPALRQVRSGFRGEPIASVAAEWPRRNRYTTVNRSQEPGSHSRRFLTQVLQPDSVGDQRNFCLDDDQVFGGLSRTYLQDQEGTGVCRPRGLDPTSPTIVPAKKNTDSIPMLSSVASRFSPTRDCILTPSLHVRTSA